MTTAAPAQDSRAQKAEPDNRVRRANYELAARWTPQKVGKMVFDTAVAPHWLESGDRFWYSYETSQGKSFIWLTRCAKQRRRSLIRPGWPRN